jgi:hypothetical protein
MPIPRLLQSGVMFQEVDGKHHTGGAIQPGCCQGTKHFSSQSSCILMVVEQQAWHNAWVDLA